MFQPDGIRPTTLPPQVSPATPDPTPEALAAPEPASVPVQVSPEAQRVDQAAQAYRQAQDNLADFQNTWSARQIRNDPDLQQMHAGYRQQVTRAHDAFKQAIEAEIRAGYQAEFEARPTGAVYDTSAIEHHGAAIAGRYADDPQLRADVVAAAKEIKVDHEVESTLATARAMGDTRASLEYLRGAMPGLSPEARSALEGDGEVRGWKQSLGRSDGEAVDKAWQEYQDADPSRPDYFAKREALRNALARLEENGGDATYARAALEALGGDTLKDIVNGFYTGIRGDNPHIGPGNFDFVRGYFGPLSQLVATADRGGVLPDGIRASLLESNTAELAIFLRSAPQTDAMIRAGMDKALQHAGTPISDFAIQQLMVGMDAHPQVLQELLANDDTRQALLGRNVFGPDRGTDYQQDLARAMSIALAPGQGDPALQQQAWTALIEAASDPGFRTLVNDHPQLARSMAEQFRTYLPWAANRQAQEYGQYPVPDLPEGTPTLDPNLTVDQLTNFMALLNSDPQAMQTLLDEAARLLRDGALAGITPAMLAGDRKLELQGQLARDFGLYALVLSGVTRADIDEQDRRDAMADALKTLVVGYATMPLGPYGPVVDVATSQLTTPESKAMADLIQRWTDGQQVDAEDIYEATTAAVRENVDQRLQQIAPHMDEGERVALRNDIVAQFEATTLREMIEEFWKDIN